MGVWRTGKLVREASRHGQILVTDHGRTIAKIIPEAKGAEAPYFARRKFTSRRARHLIENGATCGGTDSTLAISEDREDRA